MAKSENESDPRFLRGVCARSRIPLDYQKNSHGYDISGWVRNLADGRVELQVSGADDEVSAFLRAIREGTLGGHITAERATEIELASPFKGFRIV